MAVHQLDVRGLRCPLPLMRVTASIMNYAKGDILEVTGDCPTFEKDIKDWASRQKKTAIMARREGAELTFQVHV